MKILLVALFLSVHCDPIRRHIFIDKPMSWSNALKFCREYHDDLSAIDSNEELTNFKNHVKDHLNTESWVGLSKPSAKEQWVWSDGSQESFFQWRSGQPNNPDTDFCAKSSNGELLDYSCGGQYPFFCYNWEPPLILVKEKKNWEEAFEHCRTKYKGLACLPSRFHLLQVQKHAQDPEVLSVWTGLRFLAGSWFWVDMQMLGDLVKMPACPANALYCGSRNLVDKTWENRNCTEELDFVCY